MIFFATAKVEVDNVLPIFDLVREHCPDVKCDLVLLNYGWGYVDTPFFSHKIPQHQRKVIYDFINQSIIRRTLKNWSFSLSRIELKRSQARLSFWDRGLISLLTRLLRYVLKLMGPGLCNKKLEEYDLWVLTAGIIKKINNNNIPYLKNTVEWKPALVQRTVLIPETIDQWREIPEHLGIDEVLNLSDLAAILSRGEKTKRVVTPTNARIINIGSPRYSEYWCRELEEFCCTPTGERSREFVEILYLPIKLSPPERWLQVLIDQMDRNVLGLVNQFSFVRLTISPHPRTRGLYDGVDQRVVDDCRVEIREGFSDTSELVARSDICITGGTSFVPHLLWLGKPVVLFTDWTKNLHQTFEYDHLCARWGDVGELIDATRNTKTTLPRSQTTTFWLEKFIQCGLDSAQYRSRLIEQIKGLVA